MSSVVIILGSFTTEVAEDAGVLGSYLNSSALLCVLCGDISSGIFYHFDGFVMVPFLSVNWTGN